MKRVSSDNLDLEEMMEGIQVQPLQQNLQNQGEDQNTSRNYPVKILYSACRVEISQFRV